MTDWPADKVERRAVCELVPFAQNSRTHTDDQIEQVARSIAEWGWTNPVLIAEDGTIIAGHARVIAAKKLQLDEVPVMVASGWSETQIRAYVIADNKLAENAGWDRKLLAAELQELAGGFDLSLIGFSDEELAALSARANAGLSVTTRMRTARAATTRRSMLCGSSRRLNGRSTAKAAALCDGPCCAVGGGDQVAR